MGLDNNEIKKIKKMNTRFATVFRNYPSAIMTEKSLFLLANMDDDDKKEGIKSTEDKKVNTNIKFEIPKKKEKNKL